jgi:uncharacterized protein YndB with AHSA1/START domain
MVETSERPSFVYATYITTTPERLWEALTSGDFTRRYWFGQRIESDWRVGSPVRLVAEDGSLTVSGEVLEADAPRRLGYSFRGEGSAESRSEGHSRVSIEIEPMGSAVKLTVVHDGFKAGSQVLSAISGGWPRILSGLKTLLETGEPLSIGKPAAAKPAEAAAASAVPV